MAESAVGYRFTSPMTRQARSVGAGGAAAIGIERDCISKNESARAVAGCRSGDRCAIPGEYALFFASPHI
jgi:hypothetical protein